MNNQILPSDFQPQARSDELLTQNSEDEILVYDLKTDQVFCLNQTAAAVWSQCNGQKNINQIINLLKSEKSIDTNEILICLTLHELDKNNLLIKTEELSERNPRINRRELIKRAAIGTTLVLPVISFVVAPTAVLAQSCAQPICSPTTLFQPCCDLDNLGRTGFCVELGGPVGNPIAVCESCTTAPPCSPSTLFQPCCGVIGSPLAIGLCVELGGPVGHVILVCEPQDPNP
jgi:hypothetical protein